MPQIQSHGLLVGFVGTLKRRKVVTNLFGQPLKNGTEVNESSWKHEFLKGKTSMFFFNFFAETETLWSQGPVTRDF